ncbi:sugar transferase [Alphaproteobacteria bacterium]|nr:sugar transferase [Alphaproteobacteria bacterium]
MTPLKFYICIICKFDTGSPTFKQDRMTKNKKVFRICKLWTMKLETLSVPTHDVPVNSVTVFGEFCEEQN